jgi:hypothetical protein
MGYRTYIGSMPKKEYNKIKSMTLSQLRVLYPNNCDNTEGETEYWYRGPYEFANTIHEFGKYTDFNPPKGSLKTFFKKKEVQEIYAEHDFNIVTAEFLEYIINSYK